jgi:circadian clock protein KaiC
MSEEDTSDGEEDWFEQGLKDDDSTGSSTNGTESDASEEADDDTLWGDTDDTDDDTQWGDTDDGGTASETDGEAGPWGDTDDTDDDTPWDDTDDGGSASETDGEAGPWGDTDDEGGAFGEEGGDTPFGDDESSEELFEDEGFGAAFESAGGDSEFEEEDFDSDIPRLNLGIKGLDDMIQGGVPRKHLIVVIGSAGTGKTTFGLQFLHHGLQEGENAVFITLEQSHESIMATAAERGWDFDGYEDEGMLAVVDLDPVEMANSLDNIQAELPELIKDFGADRLVLDSVSLLEMMYENQAKRRTEVFDFTRALKKAGVTTFLTSEANEANPYASRHGIIEYLTDAVFVLQYVRGETQETRLAVEIQKIRNANHSREQKPYEMTDEGISVYQQANIF